MDANTTDLQALYRDCVATADQILALSGGRNYLGIREADRAIDIACGVSVHRNTTATNEILHLMREGLRVLEYHSPDAKQAS